MQLDKRQIKTQQIESITDIKEDIFDFECPECGPTEWEIKLVKNRTSNPLQYVGMTCPSCHGSVVVPSIAITLQHLGEKVKN